MFIGRELATRSPILWVCPSERNEKKIDPLKNGFFFHKLSPLDWIMGIWAIFGLLGPRLGPSGGPGRPMWGLGGPAETKFSNFHKGLFLALGCLFLTQLTQLLTL